MLTRRTFIRSASAVAAVGGHRLRAAPVDSPATLPAAGSRFVLTEIAGKPRERGRIYGEKFKTAIQSFLDKEIYQPFVGAPSSKDEMMRYAGACAKAIQSYSPIIHEEIEGMAEGSRLSVDELVLITLHEELYHKGVLPKVGHCTATAAGPPFTRGHTYVGQTWDWMASVAGLSSMLHWKRPEGPSVLAYAFPGLWAGAGLNSSGLALCWTSAGLGNNASGGARVGIPSYVLLTHFLYQPSLDAVVAEAKRATHAGWFTFVMADGKGDLLNIEGSPKALAIERHRGHLARVSYGSREMTGTAEGKDISFEPRCQKMYDLLAASAGDVDHANFQRWFEDTGCGIAHDGTIDMMVFNTSKREAFVSRGPLYGVRWQRFTFGEE
ncbi:MAG: C45 family autoproteolytic acyltransferase/hydrolase [Verrucomicrobiales bacterium]